MARTLTRQDVADLCVGATVLGTGGGGSPDLGLSLMNRLMDQGREIRLISVDEMADDAVAIHPAMVGSIAPSQGSQGDRRGEEEFARRILAEDGPLLSGLRTVEGLLGHEVSATVPVEIGGYNTPVAAILAALAGLPFVDGDTIGRAKPELMMQTYTVLGIPITPMALTDLKGNAVLVKRAASFRDAERIARAMAVIGGGITAVRCPVDGRTLKRALIRGGVGKSMAIGKAAREAGNSGADPVQAVVRASGGTELFAGEVSTFQWEDREGFLWGTISLQGEGRYGGHDLKVWVKNENLLSWLDGEPYVVTPDLICILDAATGIAVTNSHMKEGLKLVVFGIPADPFWRNDEALDLVSPKHFDFDIPYRPMETVIQNF